MNEINVTFFQIKPRTDIDVWSGRTVQFMNDTFDLDDVRFISGVKTYENIAMFFFDVQLWTGDCKREVTYRFPQKASALKAQRELSRAFTKTGEFEYVKEVQPDEVKV